MYRYYIEKDSPAFFYSPADTKNTHILASDGKSFKLSAQTYAFNTYVPTKSFSLEAWFYPVSIKAKNSILAFDDTTGLFVDQNSITFSVDGNAVSVPYTQRIYHAVATYSPGEATLYLNGERVGALTFEPGAVRKVSNLSSSSTSSRVFGSAFAAYHYSLDGDTILRHYGLGVVEENVFQSVDGTSYELNKYQTTPVNYLSYRDMGWPGLENNVVVDSTVSSNYIDGIAQGGSWQVSYLPQTDEYTATVSFSGSGIYVQRLSGSTWVNLVQDEPIQLSVELQVRVVFTQGTPGYLDDLTINIYNRTYINDLAVDTNSALGEYFYPRKAESNTGLIGAGTVTIPSEEDQVIKAYQMWVKHDGSDLSFLDQYAGTTYINGVQRSFDASYDTDKWIHVVKVLNETQKTLDIGKNGTTRVKGGVGLFSLFDYAPNATDLYNNFFVRSIVADEGQQVDIFDSIASVYGHNWTVFAV